MLGRAKGLGREVKKAIVPDNGFLLFDEEQ